MMELSAKQTDQLENGLAILSGIAAWEFQSTQKFDASVALVSKQRFADAIAQTFGAGVASQIFPGVPIKGTATMKPSGVFNGTMASGIGLLIADYVAESLAPSEYHKLDGLKPVLKGLGTGLTIGGIAGGFFDPSAGGGFRGGPIGAPTPTGIAPQLTSYVSSAAALNRQLGG